MASMDIDTIIPDFYSKIVADKYQTGFDQPKLVTMYVNKKLKGVAAVQTLSRLNRICTPYDKTTFVLDFKNSYDDIKAAFEPCYKAKLQSTADFGALDDTLVLKIIEMLREEPDISQDAIGERLRTTRRVIQKHIKILKEAGRIERIGGKRYGYWANTYNILSIVTFLIK